MGIKKNIKKLLSEPTEMRFEEVCNILEFFGYNLDRIAGSHYQFTKPGQKVITITVHNNKVTKFYLKIVKTAIHIKSKL